MTNGNEFGVSWSNSDRPSKKKQLHFLGFCIIAGILIFGVIVMIVDILGVA